MLAKLKCSNCGAEISNLNFGQPKWYYVVRAVLIPLLVVIPLLARTWLDRADPTKELTIGSVEQRRDGDALEVLGLLTNEGTNRWTSVTIEVEFYDPSGRFLDETSQYLPGDIGSRATEHFKVRISNPSAEVTANDTKMVVKVGGGLSRNF